MELDYTEVGEILKKDIQKASEQNKRSEEQANKTSELKRCPFCGGEIKLMFIDYEDLIPKVWDEDIEADSLYFRCDSCDSQFYHDEPQPTPQKMIEWWNTRKPVEEVLERLENNSFWTEPTYDMDGYCNDDSWEAIYLDKAIEIVKEGMG